MWAFKYKFDSICKFKSTTVFLLQELNQYLVDKVYLAGNGITLADTLMYYGIHHIVVSSSVLC